MRKLLALLTIITLTATAADVKLGWTNGDNPSATVAWQTIVYVATTPNAGLTNNIGTNTVSWPATNVTVTGLQAGRRYYFAVAHTDLEDISDKSNEVMAKTKINKPQSLSVIP